MSLRCLHFSFLQFYRRYTHIYIYIYINRKIFKSLISVMIAIIEREKINFEISVVSRSAKIK